MKSRARNGINKRKTILHVIFSLKNAGTERYMINLLKHTSKEYRNIVIYFEGKNEWADELKTLGVETILVDGNNWSRVNMIRKIAKREHADVVYAYSYYNSALAILAAFLAGVKKRIVHSHRETFGKKKRWIKIVLSKAIISIFATDCLACSEKAGKTLFVGRKFKIIQNGIDLDEYGFSQKERDEGRRLLHVNKNTMLLGSIGRLDVNKNQKFSVEILKELIDDGLDCKLVIVGGGEAELDLRKMVSEYDLVRKVIFVGSAKNVNRYYNIIDVFLLTSFREGSPFVLIESQANGVPVIMSNSIANESKINENVLAMDLEKGAKSWAEVVKKISGRRIKPDDKIYDYSAEKMAKKIMNIYEGVQ